MFKELKWRVVSIIGLIILYTYFAFHLNKRISLGLDLQGGMHLVLRVDASKLSEEAKKDAVERALEVESEIEDELIAIYYYLARAYETQGNREAAVEFYDSVFSLDINFADVTERLRALR